MWNKTAVHILNTGDIDAHKLGWTNVLPLRTINSQTTIIKTGQTVILNTCSSWCTYTILRTVMFQSGFCLLCIKNETVIYPLLFSAMQTESSCRPSTEPIWSLFFWSNWKDIPCGAVLLRYMHLPARWFKYMNSWRKLLAWMITVITCLLHETWRNGCWVYWGNVFM